MVTSEKSEQTRVTLYLDSGTLERLREHIVSENLRTFPAKTTQSAVIEVALNAYLAQREPHREARGYTVR